MIATTTIAATATTESEPERLRIRPIIPSTTVSTTTKTTTPTTNRKRIRRVSFNGNNNNNNNGILLTQNNDNNNDNNNNITKPLPLSKAFVMNLKNKQQQSPMSVHSLFNASTPTTTITPASPATAPALFTATQSSDNALNTIACPLTPSVSARSNTVTSATTRNRLSDYRLDYMINNSQTTTTTLRTTTKNNRRRTRTRRLTYEGEHQQDTRGKIPIYFTKASKICKLMTAIHCCNLGYDIGISTRMGTLLQNHFLLSNLERDLFIASLYVWSIIGALMTYFMTDKYGRKHIFLLSNLFIFAGMIFIGLLSFNFPLVMFGRMLIGIGFGCGLMIGPLYMSEVSSAKGRGQMVCWTEIGTNIGLVLGFAADLYFSKHVHALEWRILFLVGSILPLFMIIVLLRTTDSCRFLPESPRWLITFEKDRYHARNILKFLYHRRIKVNNIVDNITESHMRDKLALLSFNKEKTNKTSSYDNNSAASKKKKQSDSSFSSLFLSSSKIIRRMLFLGTGLVVAQQLIGVDHSIQQYYILNVLHNQAGVPKSGDGAASLIMIMISIVKIFFIFIGGRASDIVGRRKQFFLSLFGMIFSLALLSFADYTNNTATNTTTTTRTILVAPRDNHTTTLTIVGLTLYISFYSLGMGPGTWLVLNEMFPTIIRSKAISIITLINRIVATIMICNTLFIFNNHEDDKNNGYYRNDNNNGSYYYNFTNVITRYTRNSSNNNDVMMSWMSYHLIFAAICILAFIFIYMYLPETKGRSLEDMSLFFANITDDETVYRADRIVHKHTTVKTTKTNTTATNNSACCSDPSEASETAYYTSRNIFFGDDKRKDVHDNLRKLQKFNTLQHFLRDN